MSERYSRVYVLPQAVYTANTPVIISAGALLEDHVNNNILAQLKLTNISSKHVKAVKVRITCLDAFGVPLGDPLAFQYSELNAGMGESFGQKTPIPVPNSTTRIIQPEITGIIFADNSTQLFSDDTWMPIPTLKSLQSTLGDTLAEQYRCDVFDGAKYEPITLQGLWICTCGTVNHTTEDYCYSCRTEKAKQFLGLDRNVLLKNMEAAENARKDAILVEGNSKMTGEIISNYEAAIKLFESISGWKDADEKIAICQRKIAEIKTKEEAERLEKECQAEIVRKEAERIAKRNKKTAIITTPIVCAIIVFIIILNAVIIPNGKYNDAMALMGAGNLDEAHSIFTELGNYKDAADKAGDIRLTKIKEQLKGIKAGSYISFGTYEQDNNTKNGKEAIEWLVLEVKEGKALVISKNALDGKPYNASRTDVTWETCTLRKWLNNDFINATFSADEKAMIPTVMVSADKNPEYGANPGNATQDQIFLLSITEVTKYFDSDSVRQCKATNYADATGALTNDSGNCWWWLRSPGLRQTWAVYVDSDGGVDESGCCVHVSNPAVRPALWIDLSKLS